MKCRTDAGGECRLRCDMRLLHDLSHGYFFSLCDSLDAYKKFGYKKKKRQKKKETHKGLRRGGRVR